MPVFNQQESGAPEFLFWFLSLSFIYLLLSFHPNEKLTGKSHYAV